MPVMSDNIMVWRAASRVVVWGRARYLSVTEAPHNACHVRQYYGLAGGESCGGLGPSTLPLGNGGSSQCLSCQTILWSGGRRVLWRSEAEHATSR